MESKEQIAAGVKSISVEPQRQSLTSASPWFSFNAVHILVEVVALCGISYYFTKKINSLTLEVRDLVERLGEQEKMIQNHEDVLRKLVSIRQQQASPYRGRPNPKTSPTSPTPPTPPTPPTCSGGVCSLELPHPTARRPSPLEIEDQAKVNGDDLDNELVQELSELETKS